MLYYQPFFVEYSIWGLPNYFLPVHWVCTCSIIMYNSGTMKLGHISSLLAVLVLLSLENIKLEDKFRITTFENYIFANEIIEWVLQNLKTYKLPYIVLTVSIRNNSFLRIFRYSYWFYLFPNTRACSSWQLFLVHLCLLSQYWCWMYIPCF